jgi:hypothetical protein
MTAQINKFMLYSRETLNKVNRCQLFCAHHVRQADVTVDGEYVTLVMSL